MIRNINKLPLQPSFSVCTWDRPYQPNTLPVGRDVCKFSGATKKSSAQAANLSRLENYPAKDIQIIRKLLQRCRYRKPIERMLAPDSPFEVIQNDKHITLKGGSFYPPRKNSFIEGDCQELTYYVMQRLEKKLGDTYEFVLANGECSQYFQGENANHFFIMGRKRPDRLSCSNSLKSEIEKSNGQLPAQCLVIDPSFQSLTVSEQDKEHRIKSVLLTSTASVGWDVFTKRTLNLPFRETGLTPSLSLGFLNDLIEQADSVVPEPEKVLVFWAIEKPGSEEPCRLLLGLQKGPDSPVDFWKDAENVLKQQPETNPLRRFVERVQQGLNT